MFTTYNKIKNFPEKLVPEFDKLLRSQVITVEDIEQHGLLLHMVAIEAFQKFGDFEISNNELHFEKHHILKNPHRIVYAILVDGELKYIGKTKSLVTRLAYYRTARNRTTPHSDADKSNSIFEAIKSGKKVEIYFKPIYEHKIKVSSNDGAEKVIENCNYNTIEIALIKKYSPEWNIIYNKGK